MNKRPTVDATKLLLALAKEAAAQGRNREAKELEERAIKQYTTMMENALASQPSDQDEPDL